ncbi:MAG: hypothetical protein LIO94_10200 [Clostridiales bacterium]|nr:hypothetical protein [Clostridiales bacterium]
MEQNQTPHSRSKGKTQTSQSQSEWQNQTSQTTKLDELETAGYIVIPIKGVSMQPLLYTWSSHVLIRKLEGRPKKNDVVL